MAQAWASKLNLWSMAGRSALLQDLGFRHYWISRALSATAYNAMLYGALILVVRETGSSISTSLLILALIIPSATLASVSGVVTDRLPRGLILFIGHALRALLAVAFVASGGSVWVIYGIALGFGIVGQFSGPVESALLPHIVERERLTAANSMFNLGGAVGQAVGVLILAPLFLKTVGADSLFTVIAMLYVVAAALLLTVPHLGFRELSEAQRHSSHTSFRGVRAEFAEGWQTLRRDRTAYMGMILLVLGSTSLLVTASLAPRFADQVLGISTENAVYVFAPVGRRRRGGVTGGGLAHAPGEQIVGSDGGLHPCGARHGGHGDGAPERPSPREPESFGAVLPRAVRHDGGSCHGNAGLRRYGRLCLLGGQRGGPLPAQRACAAPHARARLRGADGPFQSGLHRPVTSSGCPGRLVGREPCPHRRSGCRPGGSSVERLPVRAHRSAGVRGSVERVKRVGPGLAKGLKRADAPVLGIRRFRLLWLAQIFAHTAQNATLFTLLVLVVAKTGSSIQGSLLVLSYVFPSLVFGLVAGLLVDRWRKRTVLLATSVLRMVACLAFILVSPHVWLIYGINLGFSTLGQFFTTAEAASIPALVPRNQLMSANSLFNLALTGSQFGGMVMLAPLMIKSLGTDAALRHGCPLLPGSDRSRLPAAGDRSRRGDGDGQRQAASLPGRSVRDVAHPPPPPPR